eukprot:TRINITY_DN76987_c0_g1_i1.p1 TRINITY_DN76987_c0_g1~~TRINITY_DN76987_c0_g1_i1.p1  ORF type:complete len:327 (+),score=43.53 TRINITY_DN76987_c0_g1_i1:126-1106(+)
MDLRRPSVCLVGLAIAVSVLGLISAYRQRCLAGESQAKLQRLMMTTQQVLAQQQQDREEATVEKGYVQRSEMWTSDPGNAQPMRNVSWQLTDQPFYCDPLKRMFVINLGDERGKLRREHVESEFAKANMSDLIEFFPAVDAKSDPHLGAELHTTCPCDTQLALAMSHRRIYEKMLAERTPCATIFEDDVCLADGFRRRFYQATRNLPPFDILLIGYCGGGAKSGVPRDMTSVPLVRYGWPGMCMHAYVISLQGAFFLRQTNSPIRHNADGNLDPRHQRELIGEVPHHRYPDARWQMENNKGDLPGSYWHFIPPMAWQAPGELEGGA